MAIRDKIKSNARPFLQPGEEIQAVIPAQTIRQYWSLISFWLIARDTYRVIVTTARRILLCRSGRFTETPVREVLAEFPRRTVIGPAHGLWYRTDAFGARMFISRRFRDDVAAADSAIETPS